jgi:dipeptidyl aminopeptidase/acylaminoacyl peptidase
MFLLPLRTSFRGEIIACAALIIGSGFHLSLARSQDAHASAAATPEQNALDHAGIDRAHVDNVLRGLNRGQSLGQVAVSPDGKRLAWVQMSKNGVEIRVSPFSDMNRSERVTAAATPDQHCHEGEIVWSPDSKELAFFSDCARPSEQADLYVARLDEGPARRFTNLNGYVNAPAFSPDGTKVAFLYVEGATRPAGALAAMNPPAGVIGEDGVEIQRVAMVSVPQKWKGEELLAAPGSKKPLDSKAKQLVPLFDFLTPRNLHVYEFAWSPDSMSIAYVAADPPGENNWWVAKLYTGGQGRAAKVILAPAEVAGPLHGLQIAVPRWSPDGKEIAFIGGLMSDQGATGGDVWIVSSDGGEPQDLTPHRATSPAWIEWADSESLFVSELAEGNSQLMLLRLHGDAGCAGAQGPVYSMPASVGDGRMEMSVSATADHSLFVFQASSFDRPAEIYAAKTKLATAACAGSEPGKVTQLSQLNDGVEPGWGKSVSLSWTSDAFQVQGWLMLPKNYDRAKKYPLIVEVHGGPAAAANAKWPVGVDNLSVEAFSALGYFVLQPNPRGSFGQGEEFTQANRKDFGYGDLRDILAGVDAVEAKYPVDPDRVGLTGWSYGGFMTMFAVTQTQRFKAAVAGAGISDWLSYYGENSIDQWMTPYFGASVYDDPAIYAKSSAINFVKQARTPTLFVVGDRDGECPAPQSYELWHALRDLHVPTQLVVYPNEGHGFVNPAHKRDVMERAVEWFQRFMPGGD